MPEQPPNPGEGQQSDRLREELERLISDARQNSKKVARWAYIWQIADLGLGLAAAVVAAVAGATGLASTTGRVPAAILALTAAGLTAAARFLRSNERYETDWLKAVAWQELYQGASAASAAEGLPGAESLHNIVRAVLECRAAIREMGHAPIPENARFKLSAGDPVTEAPTQPD
jgi:hypothetical protein